LKEARRLSALVELDLPGSLAAVRNAGECGAGDGEPSPRPGPGPEPTSASLSGL
jgi:hypothetical protein